MPKLRFFATLFFVILFSICKSQNNYSNGWIELNSGDTLYGSILNKDWKTNPKEIKFKKDNIVNYTVNNLKSFSISGESIYRRFHVKYHLLPIDETVNFSLNEETTDTATVWLNILVDSYVSLGEYKNNKRSYFYSVKNNIAEELVYGKGLKSFVDKKYSNDARYGTIAVEEILAFRQQLFDLNTTSKADISSIISTTEYNSSGLANAFNKLNKIQGQSFGKDANSFIVGLGAGSYTHNPTGGAGSYLANSSINSSITPYVMVGYLLKSARKNSKLSFYIETAYSTLNTTGSQNSITSGLVNFNIKNTFLELQLLTAYTLNPFDKTKFSLGLGVDIMTKISRGNNATIVHSSTYTETIPNVPLQSNVIANPVFTAIVSDGRFNYFANYQMSKNISHNLNETWSYSRITAGIAYKLKK